MTPTDNYVRKAALKLVVDGDTVRMTVDLGYRDFQEHSIRLGGVSAKDLHRGTDQDKQRGRECRSFVIKWFERHKTMCGTTEKWPFVVATEKSDSFGRYLGTVYCMEGHVLNQDVLASGLAEQYQKRINEQP